jgi:hypothetical protein
MSRAARWGVADADPCGTPAARQHPAGMVSGIGPVLPLALDASVERFGEVLLLARSPAAASARARHP